MSNLSDKAQQAVEKMKVLLVEDDELLAESLAELLDDAGYRTDIAPSMRSTAAPLTG